LDEPTASLDQKASNEIMALLKKVQQEKNMAILLISHDPSIVECYADRFLRIDQTVIKEVSKPAAVLQEMRSAMSKVHGLPFLRLNDFGISFPKKVVLSHANFTLRKQEIIGIFGDNGIGKTTFARALVGLMPFTGQVLWYEKDAQTLSKDQKRVYAKSIQMVFQNPLSTFNPKMTLSDSIMEGVKLHFPTLSEQERVLKAQSALQEVSLDPVYGNRYPETLSGGEIQKAAIARALVVEPDLLILDEPTASLDQESVLGLSKLIKKLYQRKNISFLIISHQRSFLDSLCHEVFELKEGDFYKSSDFRVS
jgi:ABC-type microcin C transport system duplicated ATPase subunit YejF